jgi:hypothetical protein
MCEDPLGRGDDATVDGVISSGDMFRHIRGEESDHASDVVWVADLLQR